MMRVWEQIVSGCSVVVIVAGVSYGHQRKHLIHTDLHARYQELNQRYFAGHLRDAAVEWDVLDDGVYAETRKYSDGSLVIVLDKYRITTQNQLNLELSHESCHVFIDFREPEEHGPGFLACMKRFD